MAVGEKSFSARPISWSAAGLQGIGPRGARLVDARTAAPDPGRFGPGCACAVAPDSGRLETGRSGAARIAPLRREPRGGVAPPLPAPGPPGWRCMSGPRKIYGNWAGLINFP